VAVEEDSYKASVVYLLMCLSYSYMELRHFTEAIECLDECIGIAGDKVADLFFRRSQARALNKCSNDEQLQIAKTDIEKAISLKKEQIYIDHYEKVKKIIEDRKASFLSKMEGLINKAKYSLGKMKERGLTMEECLLSRTDDQITQFKVLKEMENKYQLAIKFFTETKKMKNSWSSHTKKSKYLCKHMKTFCFITHSNRKILQLNSMMHFLKIQGAF